MCHDGTRQIMTLEVQEDANWCSRNGLGVQRRSGTLIGQPALEPTVTTADQTTCPKCASTRSRVVGRALSPPALVVLVVECASCGYTSLAPAPPPAAEHTEIVNTRRIERLVREAITDLRAAAELLTVTAVTNGWEITLRRAPWQIDRFVLEQGPLVEMRAAIRAAVIGSASAT